MAQSSNPHSGHRKRLREEYYKDGLDHFPYHKVLELLLFYGIPQGDTNLLAHQLIENFGSFSQVFSADIDALFAVKGMTFNAAVLLHMIPEVYRRIIEDEMEKEWVLDTDELIATYLKKRYYGRCNETVMALFLSNSCRLLKSVILSEGNGVSANVDNRKLCEEAFRCNCHHIILAHNHPGGLSRPSNQDVRTTEQLKAMLDMVQINLLDHFIIAGEECTSMARLGYLGVDKVIEKRGY